MIRDGMTPQQVLSAALSGFEIEIIAEHDIEYRCNCSRERVERVLISLGQDELDKLAAEQDVTNVACHFCEKSYDFTAGQLRKLAETAKKS